MRRIHLPTTVARLGLIIVVVAVALIGHWIIPSGIGLLPKLVAIAVLVVGTLWLLSRRSRRRAQRP